ncbi:hypothetical protein HYW46_05070 [Candidatus Daviesbacteria bacterium]|nr:hypothetical protein [Candidatus Daviesbacteria bacterium]
MTDKDFKKIGNLLDGKLDEKLKESEKRLMGEIGDFFDQNLLPQIAEKADKTDIYRLERKLDKIFDKDFEQDRRLDKIESVSVIAQIPPRQ